MKHPDKVWTSIYWNSRLTLQKLMRRKPKRGSSVLGNGVDFAASHYLDICRFYLKHLGNAEIAGNRVCEIGGGDSLASADMLLALGATHVDLIETATITADATQREVLRRCAEAGDLPNRNNVLDASGEIDPAKVTVIPKYLEEIAGDARYSVMVSYDVLEHVEDVQGFFLNCHRLLLPGGVMLHKIDLSGHSFLEDPIPPLDFQTYPDWLYNLMYSKYRRATRNLQGQFLDVIRSLGFTIEEIGILRGADAAYIEELRPYLRSQLRDKPVEELEALDWYVRARKP
jgi:cyclopropane fatty-acyl-phospholipid synthase-like methyltransferase